MRGLLGSGAAVALLGGAGAAQAYRFGITRHTRALSGLRAPLTVAFLTDLHSGPYIGLGSVRAWVGATLALRPDLILLGGDQFDRRSEAASGDLLAELARLRAPLGTYAVWGNHDYGHFGHEERRPRDPRRPDWTARRDAAKAEADAAASRLHCPLSAEEPEEEPEPDEADAPDEPDPLLTWGCGAVRLVIAPRERAVPPSPD